MIYLTGFDLKWRYTCGFLFISNSTIISWKKANNANKSNCNSKLNTHFKQKYYEERHSTVYQLSLSYDTF